MAATIRFVTIIDMELYDKIMVHCKNEFLKHHPEFQGMVLTRKFMLQKLAEYYLEH